MGPIKVCIEIDAAGKITVGEDTSDQDEGGQLLDAGMPAKAGGTPGSMPAGMSPGGVQPEGREDAGMQPAGSIDEALAIAKSLLTGQSGQQNDAAQAAFQAA